MTAVQEPAPLALPALTIGCIGCGNMGGAVLRGLSSLAGMTLLGADHRVENLRALEPFGVQTRASVAELVAEADWLLLAVEPAGVVEVLKEVRSSLARRAVVISMAAGVRLEALREAVQGRVPMVRAMPNTPVTVGAGSFALCLDDPALTPETVRNVTTVFSALGATLVLPEARFAAYTSLVGSGPAYVFYFMDALAEAGVGLGFSRAQSHAMVAHLFAGAAKMAQQPGSHPNLLREQVTSPAGSTIAATSHLDRQAVRGSIYDALMAALHRNRELEK